MCYSYHSNKALLMMKKYRIGRVEEPWMNLEPPIRATKPHSDSDLDEKKPVKAADRRSRRSVDLSSVSFLSTTCFENVSRVCSAGIC
jgi:delta8-fatty-acid desaturase